MDLNKYNLYTAVTSFECKDDKEEEKNYTNLLDSLNSMDNEKSVRKFLKEKFKINNNVRNFNIYENVIISMSSGRKSFCVTIEYKNNVHLFNYKKFDLKEINF